MLSVQYLVNCLEEDHVSHGITIQEPRPRPMKETLHSRHHSTVLPRLCSNRMESLQNLHTHAVDSAIQLQGNTRVLKKRPRRNSHYTGDVNLTETLTKGYASLWTTWRDIIRLITGYTCSKEQQERHRHITLHTIRHQHTRLDTHR